MIQNMNIVLLVYLVILAGFEAEALSYDYSASIECLAVPLNPQYNGGIIQNPEINDGLQGWTSFGEAKIEQRESLGNKYVVAQNRTQPYDSVSQKIQLQNGMYYTLSAWIQVSEGNATVTTMVKTTEGYKFGGAIVAESNCWSMLKGGFIANTSGEADLYFESNNTSVEIWIDNISLQPFTEEQWKSDQDQSIKNERKRKVLVQAVDEQGHPLANANISIKLIKARFPFGSAINSNILNNRAYQNWFSSRFTVTTFENEMKWYTNEFAQGKDNYFQADQMLQFAKSHNIAVRGHNIFWDDPKYQPKWVYALAPNQLNFATQKRVNSVVGRYKGQVIAWDVVNENLHFSFFESKLGPYFSAKMYNQVHNIDPRATLFINEYNTIEDSRDGLSAASNYLRKIRQILSFNRQVPLGIGLESHFSFAPNLPYMRATIDALASTRLPIWITELDVANQPNQVQHFEQALREVHSHRGVQGIIMWTAWSPQGCSKMCLTDNNFRNLPTGNVVDKLLFEWGRAEVNGTTDTNGFFEVSLFHGDYNMEINDPINKNSTIHQIQVLPKEESDNTTQFIQIQIPV